MTKLAKPRLTSLPLDSPIDLLEALKTLVDRGELQAADGGRDPEHPGRYRSVHAHVLASFMVSEDEESANLYYACCEKLVALNAPITDLYGDGAGAQFTGYPWPSQAEQLAQVETLCDLYVTAGLHHLSEPMPGKPLSRAVRDVTDGFSSEGLAPLAATIFLGDPVHAAYLIKRGASPNLGTVYPGEPPMTAMVLAAREDPEIHALLAQRLLQEHLTTPAQTAEDSRPRPAPRMRNSL